MQGIRSEYQGAAGENTGYPMTLEYDAQCTMPLKILVAELCGTALEAQMVDLCPPSVAALLLFRCCRFLICLLCLFA